MKAYGGVYVYVHSFLISAQAVGEWSAWGPGRFTPGGRVPGLIYNSVYKCSDNWRSWYHIVIAL
jgi:hypothetical protein